MTVRRVTAAEAVEILRVASGEAGHGEFAAWLRSQAR